VGGRVSDQPPAARQYDIVHRTVYRYSEPVTGSYGRAVLVPRSLPGQECAWSTVTVEPAPIDMTRTTDYFGNTSTYFAVTTPHTELTITARSQITVSRPVASVESLPGMTWNDVARSVRPGGTLDVAGQSAGGHTGAGPRDATDGIGLVALREAMLESKHVQFTDAVRAWASSTFVPGRPLAEVLAELASRTRSELRYASGTTTVHTTSDEVLAQGSGVCQDFAHLVIAALRSHGLPARYVSGYIETRPPAGREKLRGADASHAWVAAWIPGAGWVEVDPTNNTFVDDQFVVLGWGRDYGDVPPLRGVIFTDGAAARPVVSVDMVPSGTQPYL